MTQKRIRVLETLRPILEEGSLIVVFEEKLFQITYCNRNHLGEKQDRHLSFIIKDFNSVGVEHRPKALASHMLTWCKEYTAKQTK